MDTLVVPKDVETAARMLIAELSSTLQDIKSSHFKQYSDIVKKLPSQWTLPKESYPLQGFKNAVGHLLGYTERGTPQPPITRDDIQHILALTNQWT